MAGVIKLTNEIDLAVDKAKRTILDGGVIVYPTDTLYGIGGNGLNSSVVERIYRIKKRDGRKPLSVIMASFDMVRSYCDIDKAQELILQTNLPGPFTFIVKANVQIPAANSDRTIGIRMPNYEFTKILALRCNVPIISTSANISGERPASEVSDISKEVLGAVDLIIDGGKTRHGEGSTVVDLINNKMIRQGTGTISL